MSGQRSLPSSYCDPGSCSLADLPSVRTLNPANPRADTLFSASSTSPSSPGVRGTPVATLVARQELVGLSQVGSPAPLDMERTMPLSMPQILSGESTPSSRTALMPGLPSSGSEALVPSASSA